MNTLGWQIGAFLIGASALIIAVHIHETIENVASITTYTEEIVSMVSKITNITKVFKFVKRR